MDIWSDAQEIRVKMAISEKHAHIHTDITQETFLIVIFLIIGIIWKSNSKATTYEKGPYSIDWTFTISSCI